MIRRSFRILERALAVLVAGVAVVAGFGLWLLTRGPISLDPIAPYVGQMLSRGNGLAAAVDHALISLGDHGRIAILARGVHLSRQDGGAQLTLAELSLEFSVRAALSGAIAPTRIVVTGPVLRIDRDPQGGFHLGIGDLSAEAAEGWGARIVGDLVRPPDGKGTLGYLTELSVKDASLTVDDRSLGIQWHADGAEASLLRSADRTRGSFRLTAGQGPAAALLAGDYTYLPTDSELVVRLSFTDVKPSLWAAAAPQVAALGALDLPVSGEVTAALDPAQLTLRDATWNLSFGAGTLKNPLLAGGVLALDDARLDGGYDPAQGRINLGLLQLDSGQGEATLSGTIDGVGSQFLSGGWPQALDLNLAIETHGIEADDLPRLWPELAAVDARKWVVQHLRDGTADEAQAQFAAHLDFSPDAATLAQIRQFDGTLKFSGVSVEYFRPMPPVTNVAGTARFDRTEIDFTATGGTLRGINATGATARFYRLDTNDQQAKIEVLGQGPLADALAALDTPPLYYARAIGLDSQRATGNFSAQIDLAFPLVRDLPLSLIDYRAEATLSGVGVGSILFGRDLSEGELKLKLDHGAAEADGTAKLAGVPIALSWRQSLKPHAAVSTRYDIKARLDDAQRAGLGLDALASGVAVTGTVGVDASYALAATKHGAASVALDLTDAKLDVAKLDWRKPAGVPARASLALDLIDDKVTAIRDARVDGGGMDAAFSASFDDQGLSGITVEHLVAGDTDAHGGLTRNRQGGWRLSATGSSLDLAGLIDSLNHAPAENESQPALAIEANLGRVILGPNRQAREVVASLASDGAHWRQASVNLQLSDQTKADLSFGGAAGDRKFKLTTDDFGALLKLLGVYDHVLGGTFQLTGQAEDRGGKRVLVGEAHGADYRLLEAPTFARLLSVASLSGIGALLTGQGIPFTRLEAGVILGTDSIALDNMRAYGGAIGVNLNGTVDRAGGQLDLSGTLVPAYTLNSVLGNIPLLGNLLLGGAGQGIFAANFRLAGPIDDPRMSVNPLSALAPGFLRELFLFEPGAP